MRRIVAFDAAMVAVVCLLLVGCATPPTATPVPTVTPVPTPTSIPISDWFKEQITSFLEEGTKLSQMTEQGLSYRDFQQQLANVKGPYDLASAMWPPGFAPGAQDAIDHALEGWSLALELWGLKIEGKPNNPVEPDIRGYERYLSYGGDRLVFGENPATWKGTPMEFYAPKEEAGKKYLPFDENIRVLLTIAGESFISGRGLILTDLH